MTDKNRTIISRALMELVVDNYREIEEKYPGYTMKREAAALINYCYHRGWPDLSKKAITVFDMDILDIFPDRLYMQIRDEEIQAMVNSVNDMV